MLTDQKQSDRQTADAPPLKKWCLMVNASKDRAYHFTMVFLTDVARGMTSDQLLDVYKACVKEHVTPDAHGKYMVDMEKGDMWSKNSIRIKGGIVAFKKQVEKLFSDSIAATAWAKISIRDPHVDVKGDPTVELLKQVDLMDFTLSL